MILVHRKERDIMNIKFDHNSDTFNMEFTREEIEDLHYMLMLSFNNLLDDKIFCFSFNHQSKECNRRCESNLCWREKIADLMDSVYGEEEE